MDRGTHAAGPGAPGRSRPPPPPRVAVERTALLDRCLRTDAPVTSVCGPAGAGKTSLVASLARRLAHAGHAVAWLLLDTRDDDPSHLWAGIVAALRATGRFPASAAIHERVAPPNGVAGFVDRVLADVDRLDEDLWLVLDDVHQLRDPVALGTLEQLVLHRPTRLRLVLVGRRDPEVGLARVRLAGDLLELRAPDLAFTVDEVDDCLRNGGLELAATSIRTLHQRTEGWVAGVRIAVLALSSPGATTELVAAFDGDDHAVAEYLVTEVLARIPEETRRFLLETSVCPTLDVGLARHLTGRADAAAVLEGLVAENAFTLRLGRGREVYRYHELLHTYLSAELRRTDPAAVAALHGRAGRWVLEHGDPLHAMEHLVAAGDVEGLCDAVLGAGVTAILDGRARELGELLERVTTADPVPAPIRLVAAGAALAVGDRARADRWSAPDGRVGDCEPASTHAEDPVVEAFEATIALAQAQGTVEVTRALEHLESTRAGSVGSADHTLFAVHQRGVARLSVGRYEEAVDDLERVAELARASDRGALEVTDRALSAAALAGAGRLAEMRVASEAAVDLAERLGWGRSRAATMAYLCLAWSAHLRGEDTAAHRALQLGVGTAGRHRDLQVELSLRVVEALVGREGPGGRRAVIVELLDVLRRTRSVPVAPALVAATAPEVVWTALDLGDRDGARQLAEVVGERVPEPGELALVRALLALDGGRTEVALGLLAPVIRRDQPGHVPTTHILVLVLAAVAEARRGISARAHEHLVAALRAAEPMVLVRPFLLDPTIRSLLAGGTGRFGDLEPFVARILAQAGRRAGRVGGAGRLTAAENVILGDLPSMLSVAEIAAERALSVNTVKTHLRSIYRKLEVDNRRTAVIEARRRGLL
jgi:LuxR family transcriptional regulator, maltose regulon positive regulatory protein